MNPHTHGHYYEDSYDSENKVIDTCVFFKMSSRIVL